VPCLHLLTSNATSYPEVGDGVYADMPAYCHLIRRDTRKNFINGVYTARRISLKRVRAERSGVFAIMLSIVDRGM